MDTDFEFPEELSLEDFTIKEPSVSLQISVGNKKKKKVVETSEVNIDTPEMPENVDTRSKSAIEAEREFAQKANEAETKHTERQQKALDLIMKKTEELANRVPGVQKAGQ